MKTQNRFTSPVLWLGLAILTINQLGLHEAIGMEGNLKTIVDAIMTALSAICMANNPTFKDKF
jgi:energy-converting hydrogenase Eha subunit A